MSVINQSSGNNWILYNGDSCEVLPEIPSGSVGYSIFSPPFAELYAYSDSERDLGNSRSYDQFFGHFDFIIKELFRVLGTGRNVSVHCIDIPAMKERDGYIGLKDFPGDIIRAFQKAGFIYHSRHIIWKDPLIEAVRTKALGLSHKQICKDSTMCRAGLPDYLLTFRKPGENIMPVSHAEGFRRYIGTDEPKEEGIKFSHNIWRRYASPVWMDINQTNTLNRQPAREDKDEKHICPLQLDVIARGIELWSRPGDVVLSPFAGIGSEGYQAVKMGRKSVGVELKKTYFDVACQNMATAESAKEEKTLFDFCENGATVPA